MNESFVNNVLKNVSIGGIFLLPFIPFIISYGLFFPFISGKNFAFRIVSLIVFTAWFLLAARVRKYRPRRSGVFYAIGAFVLVVGIADLLSANSYKSFWSNFERMDGYVTLVHLALYFIAAAHVLKTEDLWKWFWRVSLGASIIMGIYGLYQITGVIKINQGGVRVDATFGNAIYLAVYNLFHIFIAIFLAIRDRSIKFLPYIYIAVAILNGVILYFTATRGAILGLIFGLFVAAVCLALSAKDKPLYRKTAVGVLIFITLISGGFYFARNSNVVKDSLVLARISSVSLDALAPRIKVWNMAWEGVKERPILGWGQESFNYVFNKYYDPSMYTQEQWFDRTHNIVFDWLIAAGILGLIGYLSILFFALKSIWRNVKWDSAEKSVITGLIAGYFLQNLSVFDNIGSYILFFSVLAWIHSVSSEDENEISKTTPVFNYVEKSFEVSAPVIMVLAVVLIYLMNVPPILASKNLIKAIQPQKAGVSENLKYFDKAFSYHSFADSEIREQLAQAAISIQGTKEVSEEVKAGFFTLAKKQFDLQIEATPNDARYRLFYGSFLGKYGLFDESLTQLNFAHQLSPKKQVILFETGVAYINKKDYKSAVDVLREAYMLAPDFKEARDIYALSAVYAGDQELVKSVLGDDLNEVFSRDPRFINAYISTGQFGKIVEFWQERIKEDPENAQYHLSLAAAYLQNNQRSLAVTEIRKAIALSPQFKEQGEYYITEIQAGRNP